MAYSKNHTTGAAAAAAAATVTAVNTGLEQQHL
jgi:hypothetical protein